MRWARALCHHSLVPSRRIGTQKLLGQEGLVLTDERTDEGASFAYVESMTATKMQKIWEGNGHS